MEGRMLRCDGVFGKRTIGLRHDVESGHSVARLELGDVFTDFGNFSGNVVARVVGSDHGRNCHGGVGGGAERQYAILRLPYRCQHSTHVSNL